MIKNKATRSAKFINWLAVQNRLATKDRISRCLGECEVDCMLCDGGSKIVHHLMFECKNANQVCEGNFSFLIHAWKTRSWEDKIKIMANLNRKKTKKAKLIVIVWTEMIYGIWLQHNKKIFEVTTHPISNVVKNIIFRSAGRVDNDMRELLIR